MNLISDAVEATKRTVITPYSKVSKRRSQRTAASNKAVRGLLKRLDDVGWKP